MRTFSLARELAPTGKALDDVCKDLDEDLESLSAGVAALNELEETDGAKEDLYQSLVLLSQEMSTASVQLAEGDQVLQTLRGFSPALKSTLKPLSTAIKIIPTHAAKFEEMAEQISQNLANQDQP